MLHPSYTDLMEVVNSEVEPGEAPVVNSRYSIVLATAKRARQLIDGAEPLIENSNSDDKPLSVAIAEVYKGETKILTEEEAIEYAAKLEEAAIKTADTDTEESEEESDEISSESIAETEATASEEA